MTNKADKFKPVHLQLTKYGKLHGKAMEALRPVIEEAWNAVLDTILERDQFRKDLKKISGKNYRKVLNLIKRQRKK